jgi:hypothetical protein
VIDLIRRIPRSHVIGELISKARASKFVVVKACPLAVRKSVFQGIVESRDVIPESLGQLINNSGKGMAIVPAMRKFGVLRVGVEAANSTVFSAPARL